MLIKRFSALLLVLIGFSLMATYPASARTKVNHHHHHIRHLKP